jgi:hypothetical protein
MMNEKTTIFLLLLLLLLLLYYYIQTSRLFFVSTRTFLSFVRLHVDISLSFGAKGKKK